MDSLTQLALFTKAQLVFQVPGTFLSFPALQPLSYPPDEFDFSQLANLSGPVYPEFCRLVDTIPQGVLYTAESGTPFSDEYDKVLRDAQTAQSTLTAAETAALQQALAFLYVKQPGGTRADSPALVAYNQYQQSYFTALQAYTSEESTATASTDPAVLAQWQNVDEPRLSAAVQSARDAWDAKGSKAQVEEAQAVQEQCAAKSPVLQWQAWSDAFNPALDELTAPDGSTFALAAYSPFDILASDDWPTFTLSGPEIQQLVAQAPAELKNIFQPDPAAPPVSSLSFEFCAATVSRSWCQPDVFSARFWRFSDPTELLSDGETPPQGECTAYITGLVFTRNIVVTDAPVDGVVPQPRPLPIFPPILLRPPVTPVVPVRPLPEPLPKPLAETVARPPALPVNAPVMTRVNAPVVMSPVTVARLNTGTFRMLPPEPILSPPAPSGGEPAPAEPPSGDVSILAFICTQLPRCPNADPTLTW
jgi:hypothetical protein